MSNPTPPNDTPETAEPTPIFDTVAAENESEAAVDAPPAAATDHVAVAVPGDQAEEPPALIEPPRAAPAAAERADLGRAELPIAEENQPSTATPPEPAQSSPAPAAPLTSVASPPMPLGGTPADEAPAVAAAQPDTAYPTAGLTPPAPHTVYVTAPTPPKRKSNRLAGVLYALLATVVFCVLFIGVAAIVLYQQYPADIGRFLPEFLRTLAFLVPSILFLVGFTILALLANRAGWWAYVLGSFLVAAFVYFGTIGVVLFSRDVIAMTPREAAEAFSIVAVNHWVIIATIIAREVSIWFGAPISRRGRRITEHNAEAMAAFERERAAAVGEPYPAQH